MHPALLHGSKLPVEQRTDGLPFIHMTRAWVFPYSMMQPFSAELLHPIGLMGMHWLVKYQPVKMFNEHYFKRKDMPKKMECCSVINFTKLLQRMAKCSLHSSELAIQQVLQSHGHQILYIQHIRHGEKRQVSPLMEPTPGLPALLVLLRFLCQFHPDKSVL